MDKIQCMGFNVLTSKLLLMLRDLHQRPKFSIGLDGESHKLTWEFSNILVYLISLQLPMNCFNIAVNVKEFCVVRVLFFSDLFSI